jgi:hypothetical protein
MSTVEKPHPVVIQLQAIDQRLGRIEESLGIDDKPKPIIRRRTMILIIVSLIFASGLMIGVNYVLNSLLSELPV